MKSLYPINQVRLLSATRSLSKYATLLFLLWFTSFSFSAAYAQGLVFQNARLESGKAGADKATYRFPNVKSGLDALVSIKGRSNSKVSLVNIDVTASGHSKSFQPQVSYNGGTATGKASWYMDFEVTLVKAGTTQKTKVSEIDATALDIDGNGDKIREFIIFNDPFNVTRELVSSLEIDENPVIDFDAEDGDPVLCKACNQSSALVLCSACSGSGLISTLVNGVLKSNNCKTCNATGKLYSLCGHAYKPDNSGSGNAGAGKSYTYTGPTTNYASIDTFATQVMVTGTWLNTDEIIFRVGGENISSSSQGAADRMYSIWFKEFRYIGASMLPVNLLSWKAAAGRNSGAELNWSATQEKNASYYIVERSVDGKQFSQVGEVAAAGTGDVKADYAYTDNKAVAANVSTVYYRLKMVDVDGKSNYSEVRTVRMAVKTGEMLAITTYPNPTVNTVNVVVPAQWQGKKVSVEIFNVNGVLVKRVENSRAGQVESIGVEALSRGLYVVKATAGEESATQRIVKSN